ncbi:hypothetical protein [Halomonas sp. LBP4]|nr:hypothetical protein [Halomonas sp. LBP4]
MIKTLCKVAPRVLPLTMWADASHAGDTPKAIDYLNPLEEA